MGKSRGSDIVSTNEANLPLELWVLVSRFLDEQAYFSLLAVSKTFNQLLHDDNQCWQLRAKTYYPQRVAHIDDLANDRQHMFSFWQRTQQKQQLVRQYQQAAPYSENVAVKICFLLGVLAAIPITTAACYEIYRANQQRSAIELNLLLALSGLFIFLGATLTVGGLLHVIEPLFKPCVRGRQRDRLFVQIERLDQQGVITAKTKRNNLDNRLEENQAYNPIRPHELRIMMPL